MSTSGLPLSSSNFHLDQQGDSQLQKSANAFPCIKLDVLFVQPQGLSVGLCEWTQSGNDFDIEFFIFFLQSLPMETISERFDNHLHGSTFPMFLRILVTLTHSNFIHSFARIVHHTLEKLTNNDKCTANPNHVGHNSRKKAFPFTHFLAPVCFYIFFRSLSIFFSTHPCKTTPDWLIHYFYYFLYYFCVVSAISFSIYLRKPLTSFDLP